MTDPGTMPDVGHPSEDEPEPPVMVGGRRNPQHLQWSIRQINKLNMEVALGKRDMPRGFNLSQARDLIEAEAKMCGMDPRHLADVRTPEQIYADGVRDLLTSDQALFETTDAVLEKIKEQMDAADEHLKHFYHYDEEGRQARFEAHEIPKMLAAKKKWLHRVSTELTLRERARKPFPKGSGNRYATPLKAAHTLRYMCKVGRSSMDGSAGPVLIGEHHAKSAARYYEVRNGVSYDVQEMKFYKHDLSGLMIVMPPGHGKTMLAAHFLALEHSMNPRLKGIIGHAMGGVAQDNKNYVASYFNPDTANGRRNRALFPSLPPIKTLNQDTFDLEDVDGEKRKQPTIRAYGITSKISGSDADYIWFDDPCDQEMAESETTRARIFNRMNGTWRARKRGKRTFELYTTTLWHHDDPSCRTIQMVREKKSNMMVLVQSCGGPDEGFRPIWKDVYDAAYLRRKYQEWRNPALYAAAYMSNPRPESLRRVRRLAYYLPGSDEHKAFMASAVFHLSMDPAGSNNRHSDKASFVYVGVADIVTERDGSVSYERKARVIDAREFHANQTEGVEAISAFVASNPTSYIHVETQSGFHATKEMLENRGFDVISHIPGKKDKEQRLVEVAGLLDDSVADRGFPHAAVQFPGRVGESGAIVQDPESTLAWLETQILMAGSVADDHGLDAVTQLLRYIGPQLDAGLPAATMAARRYEASGIDVRLRAHLREANAERSRSEYERERDFFTRGSVE